MARHLRQEAGGDPAQGPVRELANEPPSPRADEDFPDAPDQDRRDRGGRGDLDADELDDFAARLGLTDDGANGEAEVEDDRDAGPSGRGDTKPAVALVTLVRRTPIRMVRVLRRPAGRALVVLARRTATTASWMRSAGERLDGDADHRRPD